MTNVERRLLKQAPSLLIDPRDAEEIKRRRKDIPSAWKTMGLAAGLPLGINTLAAMPALSAAERGPYWTPEQWQRAMTAAGVRPSLVEGEGGPHYDPRSHSIHVPQHPEGRTTPHELGHAQQGRDMTWYGLSGFLSTSPAAVVPAALLSGLSGDPEKEKSKSKFVFKQIAKATGLNMLLASPMLWTEFQASMNGHRILHDMGASSAEKYDYLKTVLPAFLSYASAVAFIPATTAGIVSLIRLHMAAGRLKKKVPARRPVPAVGPGQLVAGI